MIVSHSIKISTRIILFLIYMIYIGPLLAMDQQDYQVSKELISKRKYFLDARFPPHITYDKRLLEHGAWAAVIGGALSLFFLPTECVIPCGINGFFVGYITGFFKDAMNSKILENVIRNNSITATTHEFDQLFDGEKLKKMLGLLPEAKTFMLALYRHKTSTRGASLPKPIVFHILKYIACTEKNVYQMSKDLSEEGVGACENLKETNRVASLLDNYACLSRFYNSGIIRFDNPGRDGIALSPYYFDTTITDQKNSLEENYHTRILSSLAGPSQVQIYLTKNTADFRNMLCLYYQFEKDPYYSQKGTSLRVSMDDE